VSAAVNRFHATFCFISPFAKLTFSVNPDGHVIGTATAAESPLWSSSIQNTAISPTAAPAGTLTVALDD
jgi:hypothetical protein